MAAVTRLGLYGGARSPYGSFSGKAEALFATLLVDARLVDMDTGYRLIDQDTGYTLVEVDETTYRLKRVN